MRSGTHGGPRIVVHPDGAQAGYRIIWWTSRWHTPENPDQCFNDYATYGDAEEAMQEYRDEREDERREQGAEEAYEAECGHGEG